MIPGSFEYHRPGTLDEALGLLAEHGDGARILAGGHSLIPMMKLRLAVPDHLIDLQDLSELRGVTEDGPSLVIGALTTQNELIGDDTLTAKCPIIAETSLQISDPQVRYCGTIGGNVVNGDPGNDLPAVMLTLDATYIARGPGGDREIAAREFYQGIFDTALAADEIVTAIRIPTPAPGHGYAYEKQKRKIGDYATAAAAVVLTLSGGTCEGAAIGLSNLAATPLFAAEASASLVGTSLDEAAISAAAGQAQAITDPASDARGPADFKTKLAGTMVRRAIARAAGRAA